MAALRGMNIKLALMHSLYWVAYCILFAFMVPLLKDWGYGNTGIGLMMTIVPLAGMAAQPLWGSLCDRHGHLKKVFIAAMSAGAGLSLFLPAGRLGAAPAVILLILLSVTVQAMSPMMDAWSVGLIRDGHPVRYGGPKSLGSLAYAVTAAGFGFLLDRFGPWVRIPAFIAAVLLLLAVSAALESPSHEKHCGTDAAAGAFASVSLLMKNRRFMFFALSNGLVFLAFGALNTFYPILISDLGGSNADLGLGLFLMGMFQVPALALYETISRRFKIRLRAALPLSMLFYSLKCAAAAWAPSITVLLAIQVFDFFSYGIYMPAAMEYLNATVDRKSAVSAQMIFSASSYGLGATAGSLAGGLLAGAMGIRGMLSLISLVSASGVFLMLKAVPREEGVQTAKEGSACQGS